MRQSLVARVKKDPTCLVRQNDYKIPGKSPIHPFTFSESFFVAFVEEGARLMYEDLKQKMQPRLDLARIEKNSKYGA